MSLLLSKNHPFLNVAQDIDNLLSPLKRFGFTFLTFMRNYNDGAQIYLSNKAQWIEDYYSLRLYKNSLFELNPSNYSDGYTFWEPFVQNEVILFGKERYGSGHGITITQKNSDYCDFIFLSTDVTNKQIVNFYLNNMDVIEKFVVYFKTKAAKLISDASRHKIILPHHYKKKADISSTIYSPSTELKTEFYKELALPDNHFSTSESAFHIFINGQNIKLSPRQTQCLKHLMEGKSAKQTASLLNLSTRTVEAYLNDLKKKTNCRTKLALLGKVSQILNFED